MTVDFFKYIG